MNIWRMTGMPAPTVGIREETVAEMRNIPLLLTVLLGVLTVACACVLLFFAWKKRKHGRGSLKTLLLALLLVTALGACQKENENYTKTGESNPEYENSEIPGDGFASGDDLQHGSSGGGASVTPTPGTGGRTFVVALDAGHGGAYPGSQYDGRTEKDENWKLVQKIKAYLEAHYPNVTVVLTREGDEGLSDDLVEDLRLRVEKAKNAGADALLSIHFNASENHTQYGSMVCVSKQENVREQSRLLANSILAQLEALGLKNNGPYERSSTDTVDENGVPVDYYAINRHGANMDLVALIVENCYMDHETDIPFMSTDSALDALAKADAEGLMAYLNSLPVEDSD